ncbi:MAG: hypothetical protein U0903_18165 [Planctomycetales bacterium]
MYVVGPGMSVSHVAHDKDEEQTGCRCVQTRCGGIPASNSAHYFQPGACPAELAGRGGVPAVV